MTCKHPYPDMRSCKDCGFGYCDSCTQLESDVARLKIELATWERMRATVTREHLQICKLRDALQACLDSIVYDSEEDAKRGFYGLPQAVVMKANIALHESNETSEPKA